MILLALRKMASRPFMTIALGIGAIFSVAVLATIPLYSQAILQRLLIKELENYQLETGVYPGSATLAYNFLAYEGEIPKAQFYTELTASLRDRYVPKLVLPVDLEVRQISLEKIYLEDDRLPYQQDLTGQIAIESFTDLPDHASLVAGRMFSNQVEGGVYEAVLTEEALNYLNLLMDRVYTVMDAYSRDRLFSIKVVGVFAPRDKRDPYWFKPLEYYRSSLMISDALFKSDFLDPGTEKLGYARWFYALDYHSLRVRDLDAIGNAIRTNTRAARASGLLFEFPAADSFREYEKKARFMQLLLSFLQTPLMLMIVFFIYMISNLNIQTESNEIAVLRSRGGSGSQLYSLYLIIGGILALLAFVTGPILALMISRMLGSANGFMEFVQRTKLQVEFSNAVIVYSLVGSLLFLAAMLLPVTFGINRSIVEHKIHVSSQKRPVWKRFFIDIVLLLISAYGLYTYRIRSQVLIVTSAIGAEVPVDPLLFGISIVFILGAALFALRLFPIFLRIVYRLTGHHLPIALYAALLRAERSLGIEQFLMVFLIMALSMGIYNSTAARTVNENAKDRTRYESGADLIIKPFWEGGVTLESGSEFFEDDEETTMSRATEWKEPPFERYAGLTGVERATRVIRIPDARLGAGNRGSRVNLMAIAPDEFGRIAWMRPDLLPFHWYQYLNLLSRAENGVLLSASLRDELGVRVGDSVTFSWRGQPSIAGIVYGFVDYWPTFNPYARAPNGRAPALVVARFRYVQNASVLQPYEIWIKAREDASPKVILQDAIDKRLPLASVVDSSKGIIEIANDPVVQSTNGVLTLGFLVSMGICFSGFAIYWMLTLKARELEFGVSRAMGISKRQVTLMLISEQLLIAGTAILLGAIIGRVASILFIPLLQTVYGAAQQVPPFRIVELKSDFLRIYAVCGAMILLVSVMFRIIVSRVRIHEALKLSEE